MRKPSNKGGSNKSPTFTIPVADVLNAASNAVDSVAGVFNEVQKTRQVVAQADVEKTRIVNQTEQHRINAQVRFRELDSTDESRRYTHEERMAELQLLADQQAHDRLLRHERVEKEIQAAKDQLDPPRKGS